MRRKIFKKSGVVSVIAMSMFLCSLSFAESFKSGHFFSWFEKKEVMNSINPPDGHNGFLVIGANENVPLEMVERVDGTFFHEEIMGRRGEDLEKHKQEALDFFAKRYGVENADASSDVFFGSFQVEPFSNYKAYIVSDEDVPLSGWVVRDGGWMVQVINPNGLTLGGEFDGEVVPPGTFMVYGDYNIDAGCNHVVRRNGQCYDKKEIIMSYQSLRPVLVGGPTLPDGLIFSFSCEVYSERWGRGLAQGISQPALTDDGKNFQYNVRNVITFTDRNGF